MPILLDDKKEQRGIKHPLVPYACCTSLSTCCDFVTSDSGLQSNTWIEETVSWPLEDTEWALPGIKDYTNTTTTATKANNGLFSERKKKSFFNQDMCLYPTLMLYILYIYTYQNGCVFTAETDFSRWIEKEGL